jgi:hypothetical protein
MNITSCGDYIRKIKAEKASKDQIQTEVKVLLVLKNLYKSKTGQDWKPASSGGQEAPKPKDEAKKEVTEEKDDGEKSKKQQGRDAKKAEKQAKKAQYKAPDSAQAAEVDSGEDFSIGKYGLSEMIQSKDKPKIRLIEDFSILNEKLDGQTVWVRARLHTSRAKGTTNRSIIYF